MKTITTLLILFSSTASIYYSFGGVMRPGTALVYNKAGMSLSNIKLLSVFLGIGGALLLFPQTFKLGGAFLIIHSIATIICFMVIKDWKGGLLEFIFLQVPTFLIWADYPLSVLKKIANLFQG